MFLVRESTSRPSRSAAAMFRGVIGGKAMLAEWLRDHSVPSSISCSVVLMVSPPPSSLSREHRSVSPLSSTRKAFALHGYRAWKVLLDRG